ncbi:efflux transporter outer membrane subunit [Methylovirgula sp. 4M-Z18]|uniref:efflux transporter outer membrane subunit n=1 Tax=Methylovirgula sp. 4M-Z18 TaxID=2293567 RepID=UPI000E2F6299|nr:efflux transporter outer membrane subunit [Methylovirgula sp. 4M-Z18]RFB79922.1 transporter [Methylovirgula sp. 4M-Z18]
MRCVWASYGSGLIIAGLSLGSCAPVGPDYAKPNAPVPAQYKEIKGWKLGEPHDYLDKGDWWTVFGDAELNRLEPQVAISNQTIKADEANYREAQSLIAQARASLFPDLTLDGSATRSGTGTGGGKSTATSTGSLTANASWDLDVWGSVRRTIESKEAGAEVSAADLANARLSAQSSLATAYFELRETDSLHDLLADTVKQYQHSLDITQNQYKAGTTARSDVITAQAQLLSAQAQEINTEVARRQFEHAIAVLTGKPPAELSIPHGALAHNIPNVPPRLPSTLLERRPDIVAAERAMKEENALIGVAMAAYYPDISLSGALGVTGTTAKASPANPAWSIGLSMAQTIFNGGLTEAQVAGAKATYEASVATYRQTVLTAFQQVEDELAAMRILAAQEKVQIEAVTAARQAVQIALNEYQAGTQNFTTVVTAETTALSDEESALTTREQRYLASVSLIVALGGGWNASKLPTEGQ